MKMHINAAVLSVAFGAAVVILFDPRPIHAVEFAIVGAQAVGMDGAGVAVMSDVLVTY